MRREVGAIGAIGCGVGRFEERGPGVGGGDVGTVDADAFSLVNAIYVAQGLYVLPAKILFVGGKAAAGGDVVQLLAAALADGPVVGVAVHDARDADVLKVHLQKRRVAAVPEWRRNNNEYQLLGDVFARLLQVCHQCIGDFPGVRSFAQHAAVDVEQLFHGGPFGRMRGS